MKLLANIETRPPSAALDALKKKSTIAQRGIEYVQNCRDCQAISLSVYFARGETASAVGTIVVEIFTGLDLLLPNI